MRASVAIYLEPCTRKDNASLMKACLPEGSVAINACRYLIKARRVAKKGAIETLPRKQGKGVGGWDENNNALPHLNTT